MKLIQKFMSLTPIEKCVVIVMLFVFVGYGGSKAPTNQPPQMMTLHCPTPPTVSTSVPNWHDRGAWRDWVHLTLPDGFKFPLGTNFVTRLTLMAYGEIRTSLRGDDALVVAGCPIIAQLPEPVSLEPGVSSVTHGLTPSNTFRIAWENACVNREATNRVDASLELFPSGTIAITTQPTNRLPTTNYQLPTTNYQLPTLPEGYYGEGQDLTWASNALPAYVDAIATKGYAAWLDEDWVGVNEQNGRYKATLTISALPESGAPCYLVCGPFKVNVKEPGEYAFPLEVFEHYEARTYPEALPLDVDYDEGYRGPTDNTPPLMMTASAPIILPPMLLDVHMEPEFHISPSPLYVRSNETAIVSVWINAVDWAKKTWYSYGGNTLLNWLNPTQANVYATYVHDRVLFRLRSQGHVLERELEVIPLPDLNQTHMCEYCCITNCPCFSWCKPGCPCHPQGTNVCIKVDGEVP